ncbi:transmembrane protein adipocyte-associated 1 homolog isoform X9 [Tachypleus tridentatus]|uniref:transmembrane protein adipocyte-associated 1 homolog isoform X9 n=1 Tax=Tachypleus tridentatus TaxID=6853 RepID=UPI003FD31DEA
MQLCLLETWLVLWVVVHFFLLSTEISVFIFGLAFGHLDSNTSIKWVLIVTFFISLAYSSTQGALEIVVPDEDFHVAHKDYDIFTHGRMLFWSISSVIFAAVYIVIFILPWTKLRERLDLPSKKSFYWYVLFLALLNITQAVGSGSIYYGEIDGICLVDVTTYIYFISFTPLVCWTFLAGIF